MNKVPLIEGLIEQTEDGPRLIGSKCNNCGVVSFPKKSACPNPECDDEEIEEHLLKKEGEIYSYTVQTYEPPEPFRMEPFEEYGIGFIDLPDGIRVLGMISETEDLEIGMKVELDLKKLYEDDKGHEFVTWCWKPEE